MLTVDKSTSGLYFTSDVAHRDQDGDYQILGRLDDVIRYKGDILNLPDIEGYTVSATTAYMCTQYVIVVSRA